MRKFKPFILTISSFMRHIDLYATCYFERILGRNIPQNSCCATTYLSSDKTIQIRRTRQAGKVRTNSKATFFYGPLYTDAPVLANQHELTYGHWMKFEGPVGSKDDWIRLNYQVFIEQIIHEKCACVWNH